MNWLISTFYARSRIVRFLIVAGLLLAVSVVPVVLALFRVLEAYKDIWTRPNGKQSTEGIMGWRHPFLASCPRILPFFESCEGLDTVIRALKPLDESVFSDLTSDQRSLLASGIAGIAGQDWDVLMTSAIKFSSQQDVFNLPRYRERARFLASFTLFARSADPAFDVLSAAKAMERHNVFSELSNPTLIGKMVGIAGMTLTDGGWHRLLDRKAITASEARTLLAITERGDRMRFSLEETFHMEYIFIERSYHEIYRRAPLGTWLLELVGGDPLAAYGELMARWDTVTSKEFLGGIDLSRPLLFQLMVPNFIRAREAWRNRSCRHVILEQRLADCAGLDRRFSDPWGTPLCRKASDSPPIWYSAGPNRTDDNLTGDDVGFDTPIR